MKKILLLIILTFFNCKNDSSKEYSLIFKLSLDNLVSINKSEVQIINDKLFKINNIKKFNHIKNLEIDSIYFKFKNDNKEIVTKLEPLVSVIPENNLYISTHSGKLWLTEDNEIEGSK